MRPIHYFILLFCVASLGAAAENAGNRTLTVNIGVVLDFETLVAKVSNTCISMALSDFYETHRSYTTRLVLHYRDSMRDVVSAASAALDLLSNLEVQAIIGPQTSAEAEFIIDLGNKSQVPVVSFTATSPSLSSTPVPYFVRSTHNDSSQVKAIAAIVHAFGWRQVVLIYEDSEYGKDVITYLIDALQEIEAMVPFRSVLPTSAADDHIREELYKLMTMQTGVFIVHMSSSLGSRFFLQAEQVGMMNSGYAWIITDGLTSLLGSMEFSVTDSMQGVLGVKPYIPKSKARDDFTVRWKRKFRQENPNTERVELNAFGLWAYDTVCALAMAVEKAFGSTKESLKFQRPSPAVNSTELVGVGVSPTGQKLLDALLGTRFMGLSGDFLLETGQLQSSVFQIVNLIGNRRREIGYWSSIAGLSRKLNPYKMSGRYSTSMANLEAVIWPGYSTVVPKGWVIPTNGKKLRIGVPIKHGFREFVRVEHDPQTNGSIVTGFSRDVFDSALEILPYALPYELIPFENATGDSTGSYNDLIDQVYLQKFDAVMGDVTIIANRSKYVDFTLPYTESGVRMVVPVMKDNSKNAWVFLKPLSMELWVTTAVFFVLVGIAVWILEHRINTDFRGSPAEQLGVIFWFSFSTMVFAHRERIASNLSRFVVVIWLFVVLILTSSYTASLTSMLTVQKLQPTVKDVDLLIEHGDYVGYHRGSFVKGLLISLNFDESKLREYGGGPEEYADALSKGSQNGGVAAIFHEIPYINLFLAKYCNGYTMAGPTFKTGGFGFVFPKGSPLVADVSMAILNVTQGKKMAVIERAWFGHQTTCPDPENAFSSNALTLDSFSGLFLITGMALLVAFIIFFASFTYSNMDILRNVNLSIQQRIIAMARRFDQKDLSSHTLGNTVWEDRSTVVDNVSDGSNQQSPWSTLNNYEVEGSTIPNGEGPSYAANLSSGTLVSTDEIYAREGSD